jgi:hypothetical protein
MKAWLSNYSETRLQFWLFVQRFGQKLVDAGRKGRLAELEKAPF